MSRKVGVVTAAMSVGALIAGVVPAAALASPHHTAPSRHVLLISVDGLHESDLAGYVSAHPRSALAKLVGRGRTYTAAQTTFPSDSFPGMVAQATGADPGTAGVYYDDTYNRALLPAGTTSCTSAKPGTEVSWTEAADRSQDPITLDAGQKLPSPALKALPTNTLAQTLASSKALGAAILRMTGRPQTLIDPAALPVDPATCKPVYPHDYLRVNTIFDVAHRAGLRTAWSDKHPAYEILNGPTGTGIDDLFTPEINSVADAAGDDWSTDNALTQEYDSFKVAAVLNEIKGEDHSGRHHVGVPAIFGMNFQTVSTAQKLPTSDGLAGGYTATGTPGPLLQRALHYVDTEVGKMTRQIQRRGLARSTTIILSAKHGQSPILPQQLRRVDDGAIIDALNAAWTAAHRGAKDLVAFSVDDDVMLLWLSNRSAAAQTFAKHYLLTHSAPANTIGDAKGVYSTSVPSSGLRSVVTGPAADGFVGARVGDTHAPDLIGLTRQGVVYTGKVSKIAEHGGDAKADRNVALVISGAGVKHVGSSTGQHASTTQIAPTILSLLGLNPRRLDGVRIDGTRVLSGLR
jgi:hypothetical protein